MDNENIKANSTNIMAGLADCVDNGIPARMVV